MINDTMSERQNRVVITGIGVIGPLGLDPGAMQSALAEGRTGIGRPRLLPAETSPIRVTAEAIEFDGKIDGFGPLSPARRKAIRKGLKVMCREIQMGVAASQRAMGDAALDEGGYEADRTGMVFGSDYILTVPEEIEPAVRACLDDRGEFDFGRWGADAIPKVAPLWLLKYLPNMPASHVAIYNDLRGPNNSLTVREASGLMALAEAASIIARGDADIMLAGATGTRVHPLRSLHAAMQEDVVRDADDPSFASRPFEIGRQGMVLGEGAAVVVLERRDLAESRGATIWGEVAGCGLATSTVGGPVDIRHRSLQAALEQALEHSSVGIDDIGHYQAQGLATRQADVGESRALQGVFGDRIVPVTAISSYCGNVGAASGLFQLVAGLLVHQRGEIFPVAGFDTCDPQCEPLGVVTEPTPVSGTSFAAASATLQGQAAATVIQIA